MQHACNRAQLERNQTARLIALFSAEVFKINDIFSGIETSNNVIFESVADVLGEIQFQDMVRQRVGHVKEQLNCLFVQWVCNLFFSALEGIEPLFLG